MKINQLGKTDLFVSELCFGALPMGPLQMGVSVDDGARLLAKAIDSGINFIDTAEMYGTYEHIRKGIQGHSGEVIINSKSTACDYQTMEKSIQDALAALGRDYLDIFLLHGARAGADVFSERAGAWQCLMDYKEKGYLRAIGLATHHVGAAANAAKEQELDVLFPLINKTGIGIIGGGVAEMLTSIEMCHKASKGIYAMKALGGGTMLDDIPGNIQFVRDIPGISAVALGMVNEKELNMNLKIFNGEALAPEDLTDCKSGKRLTILEACTGCGTCIATCHNNALYFDEATTGKKKPQVYQDKCLLCGYCTKACPGFYIRLV
ncbi:MAG: 4Fe-4S dicluster domain-containing protein [Peptococcaceae bacterium]|nr:4Fe-4S dicluster domain-containing protein [Peptococcaceae bacterium]